MNRGLTGVVVEAMERLILKGGGEELHRITFGWNLPVSSMDGENCHRGLGVYQSLSIERIQRIYSLLRASISPHIPTL